MNPADASVIGFIVGVALVGAVRMVRARARAVDETRRAASSGNGWAPWIDDAARSVDASHTMVGYGSNGDAYCDDCGYERPERLQRPCVPRRW